MSASGSGKTCRNFCSMKLTSIPHIESDDIITDLNLRENQLISLKGLPTIPTLKTLHIEGTLIKNFENTSAQPNLEFLFVENTPFSQYELFDLMAVIVIGDKLTHVNGHTIKESTKILALELRETLYHYLLDGYMLIGLDTIRLINEETQKRKTIIL